MGHKVNLIAAISTDGKTITLKDPVQYTHLSISQIFGDTVVETRAEVGRLTHNVKFRGSINEQFLLSIKVI